MRPSSKIIVLILSLAISLISGCAHQSTNQQTALASATPNPHSGLKRCDQVIEDDLSTVQCFKTDNQGHDFDRHNETAGISLTGVFVYSIVQIVIEGLVHALLSH